MNLARQTNLAQDTNQRILEIRKLELDYYANLHTVFGINAVILSGFMYLNFTQIVIKSPCFYLETLKYVYFIAFSIALSLAVHILLSTTLLQIYGPGLAINGPLGSLVRATEGMRYEQVQVLSSFVLFMLFFVIGTFTQV